MANDGTIDWIILVDIKPIPMQMSATFMALLMGRIDNFVKLPWIKNAAIPIKKNLGRGWTGRNFKAIEHKVVSKIVRAIRVIQAGVTNFGKDVILLRAQGHLPENANI